jgi:Tfp pilus assembly protein PilZ
VHAPVEPRFKKRIPCQIAASGRAASGVVLNVSRGGLFVQTAAGVEPGDAVEVELSLSASRPSIPLAARVVWTRSVAPHLRTVSRGGVGLRIASAPESYYALLAEVAGEPGLARGGVAGPTGAAPAAPEAVPEPRPEPASPSYRVRLKQDGSPRTRWLVVRGAGEDDARRAALTQTGVGWSVLELALQDPASE